MKPGFLAAVFLLAIVGLAHAARIVFDIQILVEGVAVAKWVSAVGVLIPAVVIFMLWRERTA